MTRIDPEPALDLSRAPRGELVASQLVQAAARLGDIAERHYLELKGPRDLESKANKQKIAKFILGAANRLSEKANEAFEGCAVMILGITANGNEGLPPIEMLELSKVIEPFLGVAGPRWDIVRVPIADSDRQTLVIVVEPPELGQPIYICRDSGEGLVDGRVYIRGDGETREATSAEQDAMRARAAIDAAAPVELDASIVGAVVRVTVDEQTTLEEYLASVRRRLLRAMPSRVDSAAADIETMSPGLRNAVERAAELQRIVDRHVRAVSIFSTSTPEDRTEEQYIREVDMWEADVRTSWPETIRRTLGYLTDASEIAVQNKTKTYLHDLEVSLHLQGAVVSVEYLERPDNFWDLDLELPEPPREWGPTPIHIGPIIPSGYYGTPSFDVSGVRTSRSSWTNTGSVEVVVDVGDLRPEGRFVTGDDEASLVIFGDAPSVIEGTWRATARGYNEVFTGALSVEVTESRDLTLLLRHLLGLEDLEPADEQA